MNIFTSIKNFFVDKIPNNGVIDQPPRTTDWVSGAETGITYQVINLNGDWTPYLPDFQLQRLNGWDTMACTAFSAVNAIKMQMNRLIPTLPADTIKQLTDWGFIVNGKASISPRFVALTSNNDPRYGNTLVNVWDAIRH